MAVPERDRAYEPLPLEETEGAPIWLFAALAVLAPVAFVVLVGMALA